MSAYAWQVNILAQAWLVLKCETHVQHIRLYLRPLTGAVAPVFC